MLFPFLSLFFLLFFFFHSMKPGLYSHQTEYSFFYPSNGGDDIEMACQPPTDSTLDMQYRNEHHSGPSLLPAPVINPTTKSYGKRHHSYRSPSSSFSPASRSATMDTLVSPTATASTRLPSPTASSSSTLYTASSVTIQQKRDLIITLGQALLNYGSPSYRVVIIHLQKTRFLTFSLISCTGRRP